MIPINLLPWREEQRSQLKQKFLAHLFFAVFIAFLLFIVVHFTIKNSLSTLRTKNTALQKKILKIENERNSYAQLLKKITMLKSLDTNRKTYQKILESIAKRIPTDVFLTKIIREKNHFTFHGKFRSNESASQFLKTLEKSALFSDAKLIETKKDSSDLGGMNSFTITTQLRSS